MVGDDEWPGRMKFSSTTAKVKHSPFAFTELEDFLTQKQADNALGWLEQSLQWKLRVESFYEQYEFSLLSFRPTSSLSYLVETHFMAAIEKWIRHCFGVNTPLELVDISAHKLTVGQTIRIHNDYIGPEETHRVVIHLNRGWSMTDGGLLMLFGSERAEDVEIVIPPRHGSAFAFEISRRSYHAVSTIRSAARYTLVYSYRVAD